MYHNMGKRLTDNLSSRYLSAANSLQPKQKKHRILAYVESYDDVAFWRNLLSEFETDKLYFEVLLPSRTSLMKGKKSVLMNQLGDKLGTSMIACVDSDYDYLLQDTTHTSRYIKNNPYVLQTYAYAIENYLCYSESLHDICVAATLNDKRIFDFVSYLEGYSVAIYPLFIWSVWMYRSGDYNQFSLLDFCYYARITKFSVHHSEIGLQHLAQKIKQKVKALSEQYPQYVEPVEKLQEELAALGLSPENTYLFIQGHHLYDNVVKKILQIVCDLLRKDMEQNIKKYAKHQQQMHNELAGYNRSQEDVDTLLHRNTLYKRSALYAKIRADVEAIIARISS